MVKFIGVALLIFGVIIAFFWFDLLIKREYENDRPVFILATLVLILVFYLTSLCF